MFKNYNIDFKEAKELINFWPAASFIVIFWGYLSFYTYSAKNLLPYINPNITLVAGLGIYSLLVLTTFFFFVKRNKQPRVYTTLILIFFFKFLAADPKVIAILIGYNLIAKYIESQKFFTHSSNAKTKTFTEKKNIAKSTKFYPNNAEIIVVFISLVISLFWDENFWWLIMIFHAILFVIYKFKQNPSKYILHVLVFGSMVPVITTYYFLDNVNFTLFGLSKNVVSINTEKNCQRAILVYKDSDFLYLKDSVNSVNTYILPASKLDKMDITELKNFPKKESIVNKIDLIFKQFK